MDDGRPVLLTGVAIGISGIAVASKSGRWCSGLSYLGFIISRRRVASAQYIPTSIVHALQTRDTLWEVN